MTKAYTIHKPTHLFLGHDDRVLTIGQLRGDRLYLNRKEGGKIVERTSVIGCCANHMTGYGNGVQPVKWHSGEVRKNAYDDMRNAYGFAFGYEVELPQRCEPEGPAFCPFKDDSRYCIRKVHRGRIKPDYVVYFCDEVIGASQYGPDSTMIAVAHHDKRQKEITA